MSNGDDLINQWPESKVEQDEYFADEERTNALEEAALEKQQKFREYILRDENCKLPMFEVAAKLFHERNEILATYLKIFEKIEWDMHVRVRELIGREDD